MPLFCVEAASEVLVCCVEEAWEARLVGGGLGPGGRVRTRRGTLAGTQAAAAALGGRTRGGGSRVACWRFGSWDGASFRTACKGLSDGAAAAGWAPRGAPVGDPDLELPPRAAPVPGPCRPRLAGPVEPGMRTQPPWGRGAASLAGRDRLSAPSLGAWGPRRPTVLLPPPPLPSASHLAPQTRSRFSVLLRRNENSPRFLGISSVEKLTGELPSWLSRDESEEHP